MKKLNSYQNDSCISIFDGGYMPLLSRILPPMLIDTPKGVFTRFASHTEPSAAGHVQALVHAMAAISPPAAGQTTLAANYAAALNPVMAANRH